MIKKLLVSIIFLSVSISVSKENNWQITLDNGTKLSNVSLERLEGDSLAVSESNITKLIAADSIVKLQRGRHSTLNRGAGFGCLAGVLVGAGIGRLSTNKSDPSSWGLSADRSHNSTAGAILGGLIGTAIGGNIYLNTLDKGDLIDLETDSKDVKIQKIKLLVANIK